MTRHKSSRKTRRTATASQNAKRSRDSREGTNGDSNGLSEADLKTLWDEKVKFRVKKLGVSRRKAEEWTNRTIQIIKEGSHALEHR